MKKIFLNFLFLVVALVHGQEKIVRLNETETLVIDVKPNDNIANGYYTCDRFNWKIAIPEGYKITDPKRMEELENKGYNAMKNEVKNGIAINPHPTHLIGFELNKYNYFSAGFEPIGTKKFTIQEHKAFVTQILRDTYANIATLKFDIATSDVKLASYDSYRILIHLYNAKNDRLLLTQEIYNTFVGDNLFSASISFTDENVGNFLSYHFISSFK